MRRAAMTLSGAAMCAALLAWWVPTVMAAEPVADLRADVNRDGTVDLTGRTDESGEERASVQRGAVFLPNVDDDSRRCKVTGPDGKPLPEAALAACHDGADAVVNGATDAKDLASVRTVPMRSVPAGAVGRVDVTGKGVRLFLKRAGAWQQLDRLTTAELRDGVELGLEGTDIVRDARTWDGTATVKLTVTASGKSTSDTVALRAAPLLSHHHLQRAQQLLVTNVSRSADAPAHYKKASAQFVAGIKQASTRAGVKSPVVELTKFGDIWAQDFVEPMYMSMPGAGGRPQSMRVLFRSHQPWRDAGKELYERLRGPGVGVVQLASAGHDGSTLDSMGNLETIPPYGKYPAGRVIMGEWKQSGLAPSAAVRAMIAAQGLQTPLMLDTSWLFVGHVDEFIQFLPAKTSRGWRVAVADPDGGLELLRRAKSSGHGKTRLFSRPSGGFPVPTTTIEAALADKNLLADNALAARKIRENLALIQRETGITDSEIVRVPGLFQGETETGDGVRRLRQFSQRAVVESNATALAAAPQQQMSAFVPGAVNGVVLSPTRYLAAMQWGPVIGGKDVFGEAVSAAYRAAGFDVDYLDDWMYHVGAGEVHCGTNTLRDTSAPWWVSPARP